MDRTASDAPATTPLQEVAGYTLTGLIGPAAAGIGDWRLEAIEGDSATLDATVSASSVAELQAAIAALTALLPAMRDAERYVAGATAR